MGNSWSSLRNNPPLLPIQAPPAAAMPMPLPAPDGPHHAAGHANVVNGQYPYGPMMEPPPPPPRQLPPQRPPPPPPRQPQPPSQPPPPPQLYLECPNVAPIRNGFPLRTETFGIEPDEANPGKYLVTFTFDARVTASITIIFFAKMGGGEDCSLTPTKESIHPPITVHFQQGLAQKFKQPSGTGIDFSMFGEAELSKDRDMDIYPLAVKVEVSPDDQSRNSESASISSQIIPAVFEKHGDEYRVKVVKQIIWMRRKRYELQKIYGIGNSVEGDPVKECDICFSEPRDTIAFPCRHMRMCSRCVNDSSFNRNRCPICRQPVELLVRLMRLMIHDARALGTISVGYVLFDISRISVVTIEHAYAS